MNLSHVSCDQRIDLLELYKQPAVNRVSQFSESTRRLDPLGLARGYDVLLRTAPRRHARQLSYFVGHNGNDGSGGLSNRREEHLAVALWRESQAAGALAISGAVRLRILDYQLPLKARRSDKGIGKVDLFGVLGAAQPCLVELKIHPLGAGMGDTPLRAWLEGLAYSAIVEANLGEIASEVSEQFGMQLSVSRLALAVMATETYWSNWLSRPRAGDWWPGLRSLSNGLADATGLESHFLALRSEDLRIRTMDGLPGS